MLLFLKLYHRQTRNTHTHEHAPSLQSCDSGVLQRLGKGPRSLVADAVVRQAVSVSDKAMCSQLTHSLELVECGVALQRLGKGPRSLVADAVVRKAVPVSDKAHALS
jgi:hypothetical protein